MTAPATRDELIRSGMGQAEFIARKMHRGLRSLMSYADVRQYAMLGLIHAADAFDAGRGLKFCTYAKYKIRGAILDGLRVETASRSHGKGVRLISFRDLRQQDGETVAEDALWTLSDRRPLQEEIFAESERRAQVRNCVASLPVREREVVDAIFENRTHQQIAQRIGVTEGRISQLRTQAVQRMRRAVGAAA